MAPPLGRLYARGHPPSIGRAGALAGAGVADFAAACVGVAPEGFAGVAVG
jgi:hypothetical protein